MMTARNPYFPEQSCIYKIEKRGSIACNIHGSAKLETGHPRRYHFIQTCRKKHDSQ